MQFDMTLNLIFLFNTYRRKNDVEDDTSIPRSSELPVVSQFEKEVNKRWVRIFRQIIYNVFKEDNFMTEKKQGKKVKQNKTSYSTESKNENVQVFI